MTRWLEPVRSALDDARRHAPFFFRNDDAGWEDERLEALLGVFDRYDVPIDLAVIPCALTSSTARAIRRRADAAEGRIGLHQHGYSHVDHEPSGRKHEFGPSRSRSEQRADIERGRARLERLLGPVDPFFTPPWNRCTEVTGLCLAELGFRVLSREQRATRLEVPGLEELPITIDWFARRQGARLSRAELGEAISKAVRSGGPVGVMLHHAVMGPEELDAVSRLLEVLTGSPRARLEPMAVLVDHSSSTLAGSR